MHVQAETHRLTDWPQIVALCDALLTLAPTPVVRLNRGMALAEMQGVREALREVRRFAAELSDHQPFHAALARLMVRASQTDAACAAYDRANDMSGTTSERTFLAGRRAEVASRAAT